ncbi:hypothetical protein D0C36_00335 [Mucilaginibacter conchicola]|uniref:Uncharacterized protein n=1 Tax=Mucilaginibacter conchicola TaxID=2303333 RepID=A0A372NVC1_9SPHI|nr:hypothetical protein [Mucilaginibacter conchicola]RFZ94045.1 hypothetical protein D0C36_00335 [Mucilaginibacter conchicola]
MSQHAIENLIEDTVHLIDKAKLTDTIKRQYLAGIYRIQALYDTGYTHFRVIDILLKYKFVYRIPAHNYPNLAKQITQIPGWAKEETTGELAYVQTRDNETYFYIDAGNIAWETLCKNGVLTGNDCAPLAEFNLSELLSNILHEAEKQGEQALLTNWYGLLVNSYLDGSLGEQEKLPQTFEKLIIDKHLLNIRTIAQHNQIKRLRNADEDLILPILSDEIQIAGGLEKEYTARFFLDLKKSIITLKAAYDKAAKAKALSGDVIEQLIDIKLQDALLAAGWTGITTDEQNSWRWFKDAPTGRKFVWLVFEEADKFLMCHLGLQHNQLLQWQQRNSDLELPHIHFYQMAIASLPEKRQENKKFIHPYGGWKFDITKPLKTLEAQINNLIEDIAIAENTYFDFLEKEFPNAFFNRGPENLLYLMENGVDGSGVIPDYLLFDSPYAILLAFVYHYKTNGDDKKADNMIRSISKKLKAKTRKSAYEIKYLEPFLKAYEKDKANTAMPPVYHSLLIKEFMKA